MGPVIQETQSKQFKKDFHSEGHCKTKVSRHRLNNNHTDALRQQLVIAGQSSSQMKLVKGCGRSVSDQRRF